MSTQLSPTIPVPDVPDIREFWMNHAESVPGPIVGASSTVPRSLVQHLMLNKKLSSIARKYVRGDSISNLEAAWHTLVVPVVMPVWFSGEYGYEKGRHVMHRLPPHETYTAVLSALIQPDFELKTVMYDMVRLDPDRRVAGVALDPAWKPPSPNAINAHTEHQLKQHFIYHFAATRSLPAARHIPEAESHNYISVGGGDVLSLEMLRNCLREQLRVEFSTLVDAVEELGLTMEYTWDPPVIFARTIDPDILDEIWLEAVTSPGIVPRQVTTLAFNDFRNKTIIPRLRERLGPSVRVCSKAELGPASTQTGSVRVLHNNSDAFGHHILTSPESASLDGALGSCSSAAASLCLREVQRYVIILPETD